MTFFGPKTSLLDQSQNGQELVRDITRMIIDSIVVFAMQLKTADWVCSKTPILLVTLKIRNQLQEIYFLVFSEVEHFPISWSCQKQTSVSHTSTESEIISLDAGLRMDGIP